jgi:hypothetical protein
MSTIESIQNSILQDLTICQHLYTKLDPKKAEWKPAEGMRPTIHLLQYLCYIGKAMIRHFVDTPENHDTARKNYRELSKWSGEAVTFENFPEMIEQEMTEIQSLLAGLTDADLHRTTYHMWSEEEYPLIEGLFTTMKYICAYRHQLFLYAKMCGADINTLDNWYGKDSSAR